MTSAPSFDFGYPWWLTYGHFAIFVPVLVLLIWSYKRRRSKWLIGFLFLLATWSGAAALVMRFGFNGSGIPDLPTQSFLRSGHGRVLDIGAGTGRSSIMVLHSRPNANLVALDLFGRSFQQHFGDVGTPQQKLLANLKAAGVEQRASMETADMRQLPFQPGAFDAVVSAYAMDHLNREGTEQAIAEAARVLKPGGDFLLIVVGGDVWLKFTFGPLLLHGGLRGEDWWSTRLQNAGFRIVEKGTRPLTFYLLAQR